MQTGTPCHAAWAHAPPLASCHPHASAPTQETPIEEVAGINVVPNTKQEHEVTVGISNSFGFGGHNSVVAFAPYKA